MIDFMKSADNAFQVDDIRKMELNLLLVIFFL